MYDETRESYFTSLRTPVLPPNLIISSISNYCNKITTATAIKNIAYLQNISYNHFFPAVHQDQTIKCKLNIHESHLLTLLKKIQLNVFKPTGQPSSPVVDVQFSHFIYASHTLFHLFKEFAEAARNSRERLRGAETLQADAHGHRDFQKRTGHKFPSAKGL